MPIEIIQTVTVDTGSRVMDKVCQDIITSASKLPDSIQKRDRREIHQLLAEIVRNLKLIDSFHRTEI